MIGGPSLDGRTVLVVDDDADNRFGLRRWLVGHGMVVIDAQSGAEGLEFARTRHPDMVILGSRLGDVSGLVVAAALRSDPSTSRIPILQCVTVAVDDAARVNSLDSGADAYVVVPSSEAMLVASVTSLLRFADLQRQLETALSLDISGIFEWIIATGEMRWSPSLERIHRMRSGTFRRTWEHALESVHPEDRDRITNEVAAALVDRENIDLQFRFLRSDAAPGWMERRGTIFRDADGNATRVFGIDLDVTDRALQLEAERDNAAALQMALLPSAFSLVSGYRLDAQYLAASTRDRLGGDFYDARTRQGTLTLVVGDVAGHGLAATAQMSTVQYMLRTLIAQHGGSPGAVLDEASVLFADVCHDESFVTALVVHVTLDSGTVRVASAGHPPPLMSVDGQPRLLEGLRPGPPLGLVHRRPIAELVTTLAAGEWIALFTDGVFERRDISITDSIDMALRRLPPQPSAADFITAGDVPSRATDDRAVIVLHRNRVVD